VHADAALPTIAWAAAAGLVAQLLGHRLRVPAIVPLLALGVLLGPSALGVVHPEALGAGLPVIVKLAVAVILFDGALNLRLADLRRAMREVRNLVTVGVLVTWVGATLAAHFVARLSWPVSIIFGALMTVTGPTVVQPLLKRVALPRSVKTVLEGEAILVDPVGAVLAVAVLDIVLGIAGVRPIGILGGVWAYVGRLIVGLSIGVVGAVVLSRLLKHPHLVPAELANLVVLAGVWAVFAAAEWLHSESGIMAAVAMGLAFQRGAVPEEQRLRRFKEQLTVLGISLLFVLLAASLPVEVLRSEGWPGLLTVLALMLVVRPIDAAVSLHRSALSWREKLFVAWIAPRGVVAASVASLFAIELREAGFTEGSRLLAITFLTIALTVTLQGLTADPLARLLGLHSLTGRRAIVVGAGPLGRALAELFRRYERPVVLIDRNTALVEEARAQGLEAIEGNALEEETLERAGAGDAETLVAATTNSEVNALAAHLARDAFGVGRAFPALGHPSRGAGPRLVDRVGGRMAFGHPLDVREWEYALEHGKGKIFTYPVPLDWTGHALRSLPIPDDLVVLARVRGGSLELAQPELIWQRGDEALVLSRVSAENLAQLLDRAVSGRARAETAGS
jgi:NhaP-type Na+/H+ or K+/H+ antiporter/Trk K+ transport system NAD-binding subunit